METCFFHRGLQYDPLTYLGIFMSFHYSHAALSTYICIHLTGRIMELKCTQNRIYVWYMSLNSHTHRLKGSMHSVYQWVAGYLSVYILFVFSSQIFTKSLCYLHIHKRLSFFFNRDVDLEQEDNTYIKGKVFMLSWGGSCG